MSWIYWEGDDSMGYVEPGSVAPIVPIVKVVPTHQSKQLIGSSRFNQSLFLERLERFERLELLERLLVNYVQTPISMRASVCSTSFAAFFIESWMVSLPSSSPRG
jgi:hypothetical protein